MCSDDLALTATGLPEGWMRSACSYTCGTCTVCANSARKGTRLPAERAWTATTGPVRMGAFAALVLFVLAALGCCYSNSKGSTYAGCLSLFVRRFKLPGKLVLQYFQIISNALWCA